MNIQRQIRVTGDFFYFMDISYFKMKFVALGISLYVRWKAIFSYHYCNLEIGRFTPHYGGYSVHRWFKMERGYLLRKTIQSKFILIWSKTFFIGNRIQQESKKISVSDVMSEFRKKWGVYGYTLKLWDLVCRLLYTHS